MAPHSGTDMPQTTGRRRGALQWEPGEGVTRPRPIHPTNSSRVPDGVLTAKLLKLLLWDSQRKELAIASRGGCYCFVFTVLYLSTVRATVQFLDLQSFDISHLICDVEHEMQVE